MYDDVQYLCCFVKKCIGVLECKNTFSNVMESGDDDFFICKFSVLPFPLLALLGCGGLRKMGGS